MKLDLEGKSGIRAVTLSEDTSAKTKAGNPSSNEIRDIPFPCNLKQTSTALDLEQGKGLQLREYVGGPEGDWSLAQPTTKVVQLYGEPDSRSPSTKDGQPLELWYYAFDWAGPDVPQVMEVLCTREKDGQPGHVVEITLAAPSL